MYEVSLITVLIIIIVLASVYMRDKNNPQNNTFIRIENDSLLWKAIALDFQTTLSQHFKDYILFSGLSMNECIGITRYMSFPCLYICVINKYSHTDEIRVLSNRVSDTIKNYLNLYCRQALVSSFVTTINGLDYLCFVYPETDQERQSFCDIVRPKSIRKAKRRVNS